MVHILELAVSLVFFANKALVLVGRKTGWLLGAIGAILAVFYFYLIDLYVYTILEAGLIVLMGYGFLKTEKENRSVENLIRVALALLMLTLAFQTFKGFLTIVELAGALLMLWGTFLLTHKSETLGWFIYGLAHLCSTYIGYEKGQQTFLDFQIASAIVCFAGSMRKRRNGY
ncbi:MAG: hypothetical protein Q8L01_02305 [Candidatus Woesebacteria bacterium]|nr:hypothetical protein [Candidatus Woesebacteria bacterium]